MFIPFWVIALALLYHFLCVAYAAKKAKTKKDQSPTYGDEHWTNKDLAEWGRQEHEERKPKNAERPRYDEADAALFQFEALSRKRHRDELQRQRTEAACELSTNK